MAGFFHLFCRFGLLALYWTVHRFLDRLLGSRLGRFIDGQCACTLRSRLGIFLRSRNRILFSLLLTQQARLL